MCVVAIIPARGGSKGISDKNIRKVNGQSLIQRAVLTARKAVQIAEVYVTTDSDKIAEEAKISGAKIIRQPKAISEDDCLSEFALLYALNQISENAPFFVFMQCTCPLTLPEDVDLAIDHYNSMNADTLVTVAESITTPFVWQEDSDQSAIAVGHDASKRLRRQEITSLNYIENGAFYIISTNGFVRHKRRFFGKTVMYKMPTMRSLDIDTEMDLKLAELLESHQ